MIAYNTGLQIKLVLEIERAMFPGIRHQRTSVLWEERRAIQNQPRTKGSQRKSRSVSVSRQSGIREGNTK
jgi:hypothetical protein